MKYLNHSIVFLFTNTILSSQSNSLEPSEYFQQQVNYTISVTLNEEQHSLKGFETIEYINNSPDTLSYIYFHLWPNAYKNHNTCLAKQFLQLGEKDFYFSKPEERGYIDSLNFSINGVPIQFQIDNDTIDIGILYLPQPLYPKESITISTPFYVKIPSAKFSRLGHLDNAYYITQWYPKPSVYDRYGWHPMPYLHNGEFYSEFGNYDVSISVPKNFVVAATGNRLADNEETNFIKERIALTKLMIDGKIDSIPGFHQKIKEYKTIRFVESNIHDFAWFADKRFLILSDKIKLFESNKEVNTWLYFTPKNLPLWKNALEYINEAVLFYSYYVGDYPYNHVSAVDGSTAAGGGMEYPTITLINESSTPKQLEEVIVHEVGHNWFYGILGTNERDYPAMDEGLNSFYEMRYLYKKYPDIRLLDILSASEKKNFFGIEKLRQKKYYEWSYLILSTHNADMPILKKATDYTEFNYGGIVYSKTALINEYLMNYFGEEEFDEAMAFYFKTFKFKHPHPNDLRILLDYFGGGNNIPLIENLTMTNKHIDYKISHIKKRENNVYELTIKNKGEYPAPIVIQAIKNNKIIAEVWKKDIAHKETLSFPPMEADYFRIDHNEITPDINRRNNTMRTKGLLKKTEPLQFNLGWKVDNFYKTQFHFSPILGWNYNDGMLIGMSFYNYGIFPKKIEGHLTPLYTLNSKTVAGSGDIYLNFFPRHIFKIFQLGIAGKTYTYLYGKNILTDKKYFNQYVKLEPYINVQFKQKNPLNHQRNTLTARTILLFDRNKLAPIPFYPSDNNNFNWVNDYYYIFQHELTITPYQLKLQLQHNSFFAKTSLEFSGKIYTSKNKYFQYRWFGGKFLYGNTINKMPYAFRPAGYSNTQDYLFDYYYFGRYQGDYFYRQQFFENDGALKTWTALGYTTNWMSGINLYSPYFKGFRLFFDAVVSDQKYWVNSRKTYENILYDVGIEFSISDVINIYFPFAVSKALEDNLILNGFDKWYHRIRYSINLRRFNPRFEAIKRIE